MHAGYTKDMTPTAKKELYKEFSNNQIKNFRLFMKNLYFSRKKKINKMNKMNEINMQKN